MDCLFCKSKLTKGADFDAEEFGYDTEGIVATYSCSNPACNMFYEVINLFPSNPDSLDYYEFGEKFMKFYEVDDEEMI